MKSHQKEKNCDKKGKEDKNKESVKGKKESNDQKPQKPQNDVSKGKAGKKDRDTPMSRPAGVPNKNEPARNV